MMHGQKNIKLDNVCFIYKCRSLKVHQSAWYGSETWNNFSESTDSFKNIYLFEKIGWGCKVL